MSAEQNVTVSSISIHLNCATKLPPDVGYEIVPE